MTNPNVPPALAQAADPGEGEITIAEIAGILWDARRLIGIVAGCILLVAIVYAIFAAPVFTPSALVQVNQSSGSMSGLQTLSSMLQGTPLPADAEIQLARSYSVLKPAVDSVRANIVVKPRHFPLIGGFIARHYGGLSPAPARLGFSSYSWGNDRLSVARFDVPDQFYGKHFRLTITGPQSFKLSDPAGDSLFAGTVGTVSEADSGQVALLVSGMRARPGVTFAITHNDVQRTVKDLATGSNALSVAEQGTQSGILQLKLSGQDPVATTALLTAIVHADVELNRTLRSQQAASQIEFLQGQLPTMQARVDSARQALGKYQAEHKVLDLTTESKALLDRLTNIDQAIQTAVLQRAQMQQQFEAASPALRGVEAQQDSLIRARSALEVEITKLPSAAQAVLQMQENLEVASGLFTGLVTSIQQLQVVKAGAMGDLSIVDLPVVPHEPSGPARALIIVIGLLLGLLAGAGTAFLRRAFLQRVEDSSVIEARFAIPKLAILPFSKSQAERERQLGGQRRDKEPLLAVEDPQDTAIEQIRGLRTSLQFLVPGSSRAVLCVSGPVAGVGKSFVSANLARLMADTGVRTLVIDADMRRGHLNRYYGLNQYPGLSNVLSSAASAEEVIQSGGTETLSVITAGVYPPNPAELLLRPEFSRLLDYAASKFDFVIVDAPPVLPVTDGIIVARQAALNMIVLKAGAHSMRDLDATIDRYRQNGIAISGFAMNQLRPGAGGLSYNYKYSYRSAG